MIRELTLETSGFGLVPLIWRGRARVVLYLPGVLKTLHWRRHRLREVPCRNYVMVFGRLLVLVNLFNTRN